MSIYIKPGTQVIMLKSITPANFGTQWGKIYVDSPTQLDEQYRLPYIPNSALKGILRSYIELTKEKLFHLKKNFFGIADGAIESGEYGQAGKLTFGNAYIIIFPFRFLNGKKVFIVPIINIYYLNRFLPLISNNIKEVNDLFKSIISEDKNDIVFPLNASFKLLSDFQLSFYHYNVSKKATAGILKILEKIQSEDFLEKNTFIFAGPKMSKLFWQKSSEYRYQIEINKKNVTKDGSLRMIELIPEETIFASVVSNFSNHKFPILNPFISIGAWEKLGFGWFLLNILNTADNNKKNSLIFFDKSEIENIQESQIMNKIYRSIFTEKLPDSKKILAIAENFSFYFNKYGVEAALSFELAKAKLFKKSDSTETLSHRWFLSQIIECEIDLKNSSGLKELAEKIIGKLKSSILEEDKIRIMKINSWIKKYIWLKAKIYEED